MSLAVRRAVGLVTVQDLGRSGHMHEGVPPGGALVPELLVAANRSIGNPDGAAAIEVLGVLVVVSNADITVGVDDTLARELSRGDELIVASGHRRCAYLAVEGGVAAPVWLGSRSMLVSAGLGVRLATGDTITAVQADSAPATSPLVPSAATQTTPRRSRAVRFVDSDSVAIVPVVDEGVFDDDVLSVLTSAPYRIAPSSDRTGTRLEGPILPRRADDRERSRPMVRGAIEVPRDGSPIVLGPEHPTTGGYPLVAAIASAELGRFHAIRLGGVVRFRLATSPR